MFWDPVEDENAYGKHSKSRVAALTKKLLKALAIVFLSVVIDCPVFIFGETAVFSPGILFSSLFSRKLYDLCHCL